MTLCAKIYFHFRTFSLTRLAQMKAAFPLAYFFKQEKNCRDLNSKANYELSVVPNLDTPFDEVKLASGMLLSSNLNEVNFMQSTLLVFFSFPLLFFYCFVDYVDSLVKDDVPVIERAAKPVHASAQMNASCLLYRRDIFQHNLLEIVRKHHDVSSDYSL